MRIGDYELEENDANSANNIVSSFLDKEDVQIIEGNSPSGRSGKDDKNYCLTTNIKNNVGIKLPFNDKIDLDVEILVKRIRSLLDYTSYNVEKRTGFPMDHEKWRKGCLLISDWGEEGVRINLRSVTYSLISGNETILIQEFGSNAAISCFIGLWDREPRNFVWDRKLKKVISIDHELLSRKPFDWDIFSGLSKVLSKFFGESWYDNDKLKLEFTSSFSNTWYEMAKKKDSILEIYKDLGFTVRGKLINERLKKNPSVPIGNIMM